MKFTMSRKRMFTYTVLVVIAILVFSIGGYIYFINSEDWVAARSVIKKTEEVTTQVGRVQKITTSPFGFYYRSSGNWAEARLKLTITGDQSVAVFKVEMDKPDNTWRVKKIKQL